MTRWFALLGLLWATSVHAQNAVTQNGTVVEGDVMQWARDRTAQDPNGLTGRPATGLGLNPFSITDKGGLGLCSNTATTLGPYKSLCFGHDSNGRGLIQSTGGNGLTFNIDGTVVSFPQPGNPSLPHPNVIDFGADPGGITDSAPAFAAACVASPGQTIFVTGGVYLWNTPQTFTSPCSFIGVGWNERNSAPSIPELGSWIKVTNTTISPITYSSRPSAGTGGFRNIAFEQAHPTPGPSWAPTAYQPLITLTGTGGEFILDTVFFYNIYQGVNATGLGRVRMDHISGQVFSYVFQGDDIQDAIHFDDWHIWPFWNNGNDVLGWTQQNGTGIILKRVDGVFGGRVFFLGYKEGLRLAGAGTSLPPLVITFDQLYCDACKYAINVPGDFATFTVGALTHSAILIGGTGLASVPGSWAVRVDGNAGYGYIGNLNEIQTGGGAVFLASPNGNGQMMIGAAQVGNYNQDNNDSAAFKIAPAPSNALSVIDLATAPRIVGSNNNGPIVDAGCPITAHVPICTDPGATATSIITNVYQTWAPYLKGSTTAGTPVITVPSNGDFIIHGRSILANGGLNQKLTGGAGNLLIGGFPFSRSTTGAGNAGVISLYSGLTLTVGGYTSLGVQLSPGSNIVEIIQSGSALPSVSLPVGAIGGTGAAITFSGSGRIF